MRQVLVFLVVVGLLAADLWMQGFKVVRLKIWNIQYILELPNLVLITVVSEPKRAIF